MCVCASMCDRFLTSSGLRSFFLRRQIQEKSNRMGWKLFRRSGKGEQCGSIQGIGAAAENH